MAIKDVYELNAVLNFEGNEEFTSKGKKYYVYWFKLVSDGKFNIIKVISDVSPDNVNSISLASFNNSVSIKIK